jgi:hypothetical protein
MPKIIDDFVRKYPDPIALSFKYARARMYASPSPSWADEFVEELRGYGVKSWWNIRNDDIFHFRWGDPDYARAFIENLPPADVTAGYYMGSDSYVWGREFISIHPNTPRDLEIRKHWFNFLLWGRLGYDPTIDNPRFTAIVQEHFPEMPAAPLMEAWTAASRIVPLVNRFHWRDWDFMWAVEGCLDLRQGFHTVRDFIESPTMEGSGLQTITEYVATRRNDMQKGITPPPQVSNELDALADRALAIVRETRESDRIVSKELSELLYDIEAMSWLGKYYAAKIRGAIHLKIFIEEGSPAEQARAVEALEEGVAMWRAYARAATCNYRPQFMAKTRTIDWHALTEEARRDVEIARAATPK